MATYGQMVQRIVDESHRTDISITAIVQQQILSAIEFYSGKRFYFNEQKYSFTTSSSQAYYPLSALAPATSTLMEPDTITVIVYGRNYRLDPRTFQEINEADNGNVFGYPYFYAEYANQFRLFPVPNSAYITEVFGQAKLATLSASGDTNAWTTDAEELIRSRAEATLYGLVINDPARAQIAMTSEIMALSNLRDKTNKLTSSGTLRGSGLA